MIQKINGVTDQSERKSSFTIQENRQDIMNESVNPKKNKRNFIKQIKFLQAGILLCMLGFVFLQIGCSNQKENTGQEPSDKTSFEEKNRYSDTAIIVELDTTAKEIKFQNIETGLRYTLTYDERTYFTGKSEDPMTPAQLKTGSIADIVFQKSKKRLENLEISGEYFTYNYVDSFHVTANGKRMEYLGEKYVINDYAVIADGNRNLEIAELQEGDIISLYGKDHEIYSISLDSGHGYVKLLNDSYFIGGFVEFGKLIKPVSEGMLLTVPEGTYNMLISNDGISGQIEVTVGRNQEVSVDLGGIDTEKKYGNILFALNPSTASVYVDGVRVNTSGPVKMEYGIHQLIVMASGYQTLTEYIKVGSASASVSIELKKTDTQETEKDSQSSSQSSEKKSGSENGSNSSEKASSESSQKPSDNSSEKSSEENSEENSNQGSSSEGDASTTNPKVYIDAPVGVEVYVDGNYIGKAPVNFPKTEGDVVVTLRKSGYLTRSYTLSLDGEKTDVRYSFSELIK